MMAHRNFPLFNGEIMTVLPMTGEISRIASPAVIHLHSSAMHSPRILPARPFLLASLVALASFLGACGSADAEDAPGEGAWGESQAWRLVEETRIGSADGEGADVFGWVVDVALDPLGRVWVADGQGNRISVFDSAGTHVRTIGRKGGGPEEFDGISGMDWAADGNLWVLDGGNMRFAVYDTAGRFIATHRRDVNVVVSPWPLGFDKGGSLYDLGSFTGQEAERTSVVRFGPGLQARDTFRIPAFEEPVFEVTQQDGGNRNITRVGIPFAPNQQWRMDPEGFVWVAVTDRYRLTRHRFDGTVDRVVERDARPLPVTAEQRQKALEGFGDFRQKGGRIDESRIPRTHPVISGFFFGDDGHLWVIPSRSTDVVADVFAPDGAYLGEVPLAGRILPSPVPAIRAGRMAAVSMDEDGVPSVVVLRIEKPAA